ncbi:MAG: DUF6876 family protein [Azovibrio sp.]|uniref:DUF6876 family protein n=1 Tax=Azovibrio sp. TaxID=1872673 RepID=UPI003C746444
MAITKEDLAQFYGTEHYYRFSPMYHNMYLTDGTKFLAEEAGAYWLMDMIASYLPRIKQHGFGSVKLVVKDGVGTFTIDDGNGNVFAKQKIDYTDFPFDEFSMFVAEGMEDTWVIMLTSEY